jgi:hypothetical protein
MYNRKSVDIGIGGLYCWTFDFMDLDSSSYKEDIHIIKNQKLE